MKIIKKITLIFIFFSLYQCGFKAIDKKQIIDFSINEINTVGNKRINFKIKNNLMINSVKKSSNILNINIKTEKIKSVKEKNINNEITKYQISLNAFISFNLLNDQKKSSFNVNVDGDYLVGNNYSKTLNNEKKLTNDLVESLYEQILKEITLKLNDI